MNNNTTDTDTMTGVYLPGNSTVESCERIGSAELAGSFPRSLLRG
jgi:hypothetical protein